MSGPVEQLHYTWAPRGLEGVNRLQIAAMSAGFRQGPAAALLPAVRKLCRYDPPTDRRDRLPVSFGWLDYRGHRIAFRRAPRATEQGKPGNFAAHILLGDPASMPVSMLAISFSSELWWSGSAGIGGGPEDGFELPTLDLADALRGLPAGPGPRTATLNLMGALARLSEGSRLVVSGGSELFAAALGELARRLPETLEGMSVSTYEGAPTFPFDLVGAHGAASNGSFCDLEARWSGEDAVSVTAERLLEDGPRAESLRAAVGPAGRACLGRARRIVALTMTGDGDGGVRPDDNAELLADPATLRFVAGAPAGCLRIATAAWGPLPGILAALRAVFPELDVEERAALCGSLVRVYEVDGGNAPAQVAGALPDGEDREELLSAILSVVRADSDRARKLLPDDVVVILAHAARQGVPATALDDLLLSTAPSIGHCAPVDAVPDGYLLVMFRGALKAPANYAALAAALNARPDLLRGEKLDRGEAEASLRLLSALPSERREGPMEALLPSLMATAPEGGIGPLLDTMRPADTARCLLAAAEALDEMPPGLLAPFRSCAIALLDEGRGERAKVLMDQAPDDDLRRAGLLLTSLLGFRPATATAERLLEVRGLHDPELAESLTGLALRRTVEQIRVPPDTAAVWSLLEIVFPETAAGTLRRLLELAAVSENADVGGPILAWLARSLLPAEPALLGRRGRLRQEESDRLARQVALMAPAWQWHGYEGQIEADHGSARRWWDELDAERARGLSRSRNKGRLPWRR